MLAEIAKLFDPLGWMAPCTTAAKILMQSLWLLLLEWDTPLPESILHKWNIMNNQLQHRDLIRIDRWVGYSTANLEVSHHGFADASEKAYAAVVY